jgi:nitrite reductase/ring-hydroxylating ferredoxin subunit
MAWFNLCSRDEIASGQARGFDPQPGSGSPLFVVHHQGQWRAWRDWCPHWRAGPMAWRRHAYLSADGSAIVCHAHGASFDPLSGICTLGPCPGERLRHVELRIDAKHQVQVWLDAEFVSPTHPDPQGDNTCMHPTP